MPETSIAEPSRLGSAVSVGKDVVALLRDAALFVLAGLLIVFPLQFNSILVNAGFEEGSLVGFKWKSTLLESDKALKDAQATITELQGKNDELVKALADANAHLTDPALTRQVAQLQTENKQVKDAAEQVQTTVAQAIESNSPLVQKALSATSLATTDARTATRRPRSDYSVGLQTLGVDDPQRLALNEKIKAEGFGLDPVTWSYPAGERPSWFALRSTVFYYSTSAQPAAQDLAQVMRTLTGQEFAVQRGAGLGVDPARKDVTLYVHYLNR